MQMQVDVTGLLHERASLYLFIFSVPFKVPDVNYKDFEKICKRLLTR
jgi:hypothetical protein